MIWLIVALVVVFFVVRFRRRRRREDTSDGLLIALNAEYLAKDRASFKAKPYKGQWWV